MKRRDAIRQATLLAFGMVMGKFDALQGAETAKKASKSSGGALTVDLNQWKEVVFRHNGMVVAVSVSEIFKSLQEPRA